MHIGHFTALPRLTLQAGLANTVPGAGVGPLGLHHHDHADDAFEVPPTAMSGAMTGAMDLDPPKMPASLKPASKWKIKKKSGLRIMVDA